MTDEQEGASQEELQGKVSEEFKQLMHKIRDEMNQKKRILNKLHKEYSDKVMTVKKELLTQRKEYQRKKMYYLYFTGQAELYKQHKKYREAAKKKSEETQ